MAIKVKWFATLVKRTKSRQQETEVDYFEGLTPLQIFLDEGFNEADAESVMMIVNDEQAEGDTPLQDGDRVEFMVSIQGGAEGTASELIFLVEEAEEGGFLARALGEAIFTQADSWEELRANVVDAVAAHYDEPSVSRIIRLHFVRDEVLTA